MKILLYDMGAYTQNDIMESLEYLGIAYKNVLYKQVKEEHLSQLII